MSNRSSTPLNRRRGDEAPQSPSFTELAKDGENGTTEVLNVQERRRLKNRLSQRNHRRKVRQHISALEAQLLDNMLMGPRMAGQQTTPSSTSQSSTAITESIDLRPKSNQSVQPASNLDQVFDLNFQGDMDQMGASPTTLQATSQPTPSQEYPLSTTSCDFACFGGASCSETLEPSGSGIVGEKFIDLHTSSPSHHSQHSQSIPFPDAATYRKDVECCANSKAFFIMEPHQHLISGPPIPSRHLRLGCEGSFPSLYHVPHIQPQLYHASHIQPQQPALVPRYSPVTAVPAPSPSAQHSHHTLNGPYRLSPSSPPNFTPQQTYVIVPVPELYSPHSLSSSYEQNSIYSFPGYPR